MIASPGDVKEERDIIRDVVLEWNAINSKAKGVVLLPVAWETHAAPLLGETAQAIINRQVLVDADLLIAAFWTRLGTPTGEAASGTVEEIERHIAASKPAMLYFSNANISLKSIDYEQYSALKKFKDICYTKGLCEEYDSTTSFKEKLTRELAINIRDYIMARKEIIDIQAINSDPIFKRLVPKAVTLIREAYRDAKHTIYCRSSALAGLIISTSEITLTNSHQSGNEDEWSMALSQVKDFGLFTPISSTDGTYRLTQRGIGVAERICDVLQQSQRISKRRNFS